MNPKKTMVLSASLTAFVMVILFSVISRVSSLSAQPAAITPTVQDTMLPDTPTPTDQPTETPTATTPAPLTYDEAASLAAAALNHMDVYSVENFKYQGLDSFKVVFSSGDIAYIGLNRQVLGREKPTTVAAVVIPNQPVLPVQPIPTPKKRRVFSGGSNSSASSSPVSAGSEANDN